MDCLTMSYSTELSRFGTETSIIFPGAFTKGINHFAHAGRPDSSEVAEEYFGTSKPHHGLGEEILKRMSGLEPLWADIEEVAKEFVKVVAAGKGTRLFRVHIDPISDGAEAVNTIADQKRADLFKSIEMEDLLRPM